MESSSTMSETHCHARSLSLPSTSHPTTLKVEDAFTKLTSLSSSLKADKVSKHLTHLVNLYNCVEDLLQLPLTQQVLLQYRQQEKWVEDLLDGSVKVLDVCNSARDFLLMLKEQVQDLQTVLRRRGSKSAKEEKVGAYICFRKKMKKDVSKCLGQLKRMDNQCVSSPLLDQDQHLHMVVKVLKEVKAQTVSFFQSLLSFIDDSAISKSTKWSFVSKLKHQNNMSELQCVDLAVLSLSSSSKDVEVQSLEKAKKGLEGVEPCIRELESGLECLFKHLIQSQVSLLNIFTL